MPWGCQLLKPQGLRPVEALADLLNVNFLNINVNHRKQVKIKINATCKSNINMGKRQLMLHYGA